MAIDYYKQEIEFDLPNENELNKWLENIVLSNGKSIAQITYVFCNDEYLLNINREYLNHDYYTDIITFPYKQGDTIESDIFISVDRIKENAITFESSFEKELLRVMSHGILHLIGYKDKTEEEQLEMREKENWAINLFENQLNG